MKTGRYNIKELLTHNEIEQIIIPEIQRDYVWKSKNVRKLLDSIIKNFLNKKEAALVIEIGGERVTNVSINTYLQKEYNKLIHNTKIGFIYAYHDNEYAGKFFLIDGQQRFTTIYLLLLAVYVKSGKKNDFRTLYFKDDILKIDYKVREHSHEFMNNFIKNELEDVPKDIFSSIKYYKNDYEKDETINNLILNYTLISEILEENKYKLEINNKYDDFIEYIEDYIEVNYFDTNISEQGEQLYLYMNSRGEFLSYQEKIKSEIVKKENTLEDKKEVGKKWEEWQNFFWKQRGINKVNGNENADIGFEEFLKWCSILHICTSDNSESTITFEQLKDRRQTLREAKENYINRTKEKTDNQREYLNKYQIENLTADYISNNFDAVSYLSNLNSKYIPITANWLFDINRALNYVQILPLIYLINNSSWQDETQKIRDIMRLAMFLKNITYFLSISKNPDSATIDVIDLVKSMCDDNKTDITYFLNPKYADKFKSILTPYIIKQLSLFEEATSRNELETVIWDIILNKNLNQFLKGDTSILYRSTEFYLREKSIINNNYNELLERFHQITSELLLNNDIYKNGGNSDLFRRSLLTFGDYLVETNGSYRFGNRIDGYSFGYSDTNADNIEMNEIFQSDKMHLVNMLVALFKQPKIDLNQLIKTDNATEINDWREPFIKNAELLSYCRKKRILFENEKRIILISEKDKGYIEIQCKLLEILNSDNRMRIVNHNTCVIDFDVFEKKLIPKEKSFALDIIYTNNEWRYLIFRLDEDIKSNLRPFVDSNWGTITENQLIPFDDLIYSDNVNLSITENINELDLKVTELLKKIEDLLIN